MYFLVIFLLSCLVKTNVNEYYQSLGSSSQASYKIKITSHFVRTLATIQVQCYGDRWPFLSPCHSTTVSDCNSQQSVISRQSRKKLSYQIAINKYLKTNIRKTFQAIWWRIAIWMTWDISVLGNPPVSSNWRLKPPRAKDPLFFLMAPSWYENCPIWVGQLTLLGFFPLDVLQGRFQCVDDYLLALWF